MNGVPASLGSLCVSRLLDENDTGKAVVQVPQVHRTHTTFKVSGRRERERERCIKKEKEQLVHITPYMYISTHHSNYNNRGIDHVLLYKSYLTALDLIDSVTQAGSVDHSPIHMNYLRT